MNGINKRQAVLEVLREAGEPISVPTALRNSFCPREINCRVSKGIGLPWCLRKNRQSGEGLKSPQRAELDKGIATKKFRIKVITIKVITFTKRQAYAVSRART